MEKLQTTLRSLRLSGVAAALPSRYGLAKAQEMDYLDFLEVLVEDELAKRKDALLSRRIKLAGFPFLAGLLTSSASCTSPSSSQFGGKSQSRRNPRSCAAIREFAERPFASQMRISLTRHVVPVSSTILRSAGCLLG